MKNPFKKIPLDAEGSRKRWLLVVVGVLLLGLASLVLYQTLREISPEKILGEEPSRAGVPTDKDAPASYPDVKSQLIPGRYIVVFKPHVTNPASQAANLMQGRGGQIHHTYSGALKGFAATIPEAALQGLRNNPNVDYIEQDATVQINQVLSWGLDRVDQYALPLDSKYLVSANGAGAYAFIIDTGIRADHNEFTGRVRTGFNAIADANGSNDCNGHGTHVAGTVGGSTSGVAKGVLLVPVRVLDCAGSGAWSGVVAGIDWVANSTLRPAVANMSLGGGVSAAVDAAVAGAVAKGVTMVVAAGNSNLNACDFSPAREPSAITVGATIVTDSRAYYSNIGSCVDILAPGGSITSAWFTSASAFNTISGTSMASPHVAGVVALALGKDPGLSPAALSSLLLSTATKDKLLANTLGAGTPNLMVYALLSGGGGSGSPPAPITQSVAFKAMVGSSVKSGGNWKAYGVVTVANVTTGAGIGNASVSGSFTPGGNSSCTTSSNGSCTLSSATLKMSGTSSTVLTGSSITGTLMSYDASKNSIKTVTIAKP